MKRIKYLGTSEPVLTPRATISGRVSLKSHIFGNLRDGRVTESLQSALGARWRCEAVGRTSPRKGQDRIAFPPTSPPCPARELARQFFGVSSVRRRRPPRARQSIPDRRFVRSRRFSPYAEGAAGRSIAWQALEMMGSAGYVSYVASNVKRCGC